MHSTPTNPGDASVLASLRSLAPGRPLGLHEALTVAEQQAQRLLALSGIDYPPVPTAIICDLPKIVLEHDPLLPRQAASGVSHWDEQRHTWVISLNPDEPRTRQRFSVAHEYKHIIDHGHPGLTGWLPAAIHGLSVEEFIAEYFAGCVPLPKPVLKAAYFDGIQRPVDLAELFDVSVRAVEVRLTQLGLTDARPASGDSATHPLGTYRHRAPRHTSGSYRPRSARWQPLNQRQKAAS